MKRIDQEHAKTLLTAAEYAATLKQDFTHEPPTKVDLKYAATMTRLDGVLAHIAEEAAAQASGTYQQHTRRRRLSQSDLMNEFRDIKATVNSIAAETGNSSIRARFRIPKDPSAVKVIATARAMAAAIRELGLNEEFEAHGHPADTATDLERMATSYENKGSQQGAALGTRVGATAAIPGDVKAGRDAVTTLTAIFRRVYKGNVAVLAAWKSVSRFGYPSPESPEDPTPEAPPAP
jgi:hypothetical protein